MFPPLAWYDFTQANFQANQNLSTESNMRAVASSLVTNDMGMDQNLHLWQACGAKTIERLTILTGLKGAVVDFSPQVLKSSWIKDFSHFSINETQNDLLAF